MPGTHQHEVHRFDVRGVRFLVDANTGSTYRAETTSPDELTCRAHAQRHWRYPTDWSEAYVALHTSVFCNMACEYCQVADHRRDAEQPEMDVQSAREAMDYAVFGFGERAPKITFSFAISGEPLLEWETFLQLYDYGQTLAERTGKALTWGISTNGLRIDDRVIEELGARPDVTLAVSIDGPAEAQDAMRRTPVGAATYATVARNAVRVLESGHPHLEYTHAVPVLTAAFPHPDRVLEHLLGLGFNAVSITPVRAQPGAEFGVNRKTLPAFRKGYSDLAQMLARDLTEGDGRYHAALLDADPFRTLLRRGASRRRFPLRCSAAANTIAIAPDGSIYPCDALVGFEEARLGHIRDGMDRDARARFMHCYVNKREACSECWARLICGGECHYVALLRGSLDAVDPAYCGLVKHMVEEAVWLAGTAGVRIQESGFRMTATAGTAEASEQDMQDTDAG